MQVVTPRVGVWNEHQGTPLDLTVSGLSSTLLRKYSYYILSDKYKSFT